MIYLESLTIKPCKDAIAGFYEGDELQAILQDDLLVMDQELNLHDKYCITKEQLYEIISKTDKARIRK